MISNFTPQNTYTGLLQFKNQLRNSISEQSRFISHGVDIIDGTDSNFSSLFSLGFSSADRQAIFSIEKLSASSLKVRIFDSESHVQLAETNLSTNDFTQDNVIGETEYKPSDIIDALNANEKINEMYSEVNDLFLTKSKVAISVISSTLDPYKEAIPNETAKLISNLASITDDSNLVSQLGFMEVVKTSLNYGKQAGTQEKFTLSDINPYVVTGLANVIFTAIYNIVATVFATILTICNKLLGLFVAAILSIASIWIKAKEIYGQINIDQNQPIWHITGAVRNRSVKFITGCRSQVVGTLPTEDLMAVSILPGCELYSWMSGDTGNYLWPRSDLRQQVYVTLNVHPDRFMEYVRLSTRFRTYGTSGRFNITNEFFMRETDDVNPNADIEAIKNKIWLTEDELTQLNVDGEFLRRTIAANIMAFCLCHLRIYGEFAIENCLDAWPITIVNGVWTAPVIGATAMSEFCKKNNSSSFVYFQDWTIERISSLHQALFNVTNYLHPGNGMPTESLTDNGIVYITNTGNASVVFGYTSAFHNMSTETNQQGSNLPLTFYWNDGATGRLDYIDYYPVSPKVTLPALDFENLRNCLIIIGVALAAVMISAKVSTVLIKKRTYFKKIDAANRLQTAYNNAVSDPSVANKKAFFKERRMFNLKAKIFGWGSYDPINKWWDPRASVSSLIDSNNQFGDSAQVSNGISDIKRVITGV